MNEMLPSITAWLKRYKKHAYKCSDCKSIWAVIVYGKGYEYNQNCPVCGKWIGMCDDPETIKPLAPYRVSDK